MKEKERLLTIKEVCQELKISRRTLYRLLKKMHLPGFKVGNQWRFEYGAVRNYLMYLSFEVPKLYRAEVVERYRSSPFYEVKEDEKGGQIRLKSDKLAEARFPRDYAERKLAYEGKLNISLACLDCENWVMFTGHHLQNLRFSYRKLGGVRVVRLSPQELRLLGYHDSVHWLQHEIKWERTV